MHHGARRGHGAPPRRGATRGATLLVALACACGDHRTEPDAAAAVACAIGPALPEVACGTCAAGVCVDGVCRATCELHAGVPTCDRATTCVPRDDLGLDAGTGVCEPVCDPLTQCARTSARPEACGSLDTAAPDRGCVGVAEFTCRAVTSTATDLEPPTAGACAPGYVALLWEGTGSSRLICAGLCAALEVDNTAAHAGNELGDATTAGKLLDQPGARTGDATCALGAKGNHPSSTCRFLWPLLEERGAIPASYALRYLDTLGVCVAIANYRFDSDGDGTLDTPYPSCATLPPRSARTPGRYDDAYDWGCQKRASGVTARDVRLDLRLAVPTSLPTTRLRPTGTAPPTAPADPRAGCAGPRRSSCPGCGCRGAP